MALHMLTTIDNPYNPHTQFDEWDAWDRGMGYHTLSYLARVVKTSYELSEADQDRAIEIAIEDVLKHNITGVYIRVSA